MGTDTVATLEYLHQQEDSIPDSGLPFVDGAPAPTDCPRVIFLPVNDGRMIALNADTGAPCQSFADHGTLDLQEGMGVKTLGFYEPTSPSIVSDKIIVIGGAVIVRDPFK